ncbi:MAG: hypothetical protein AAGK14_14790 [Verrucomicrobiota bacterium]
MKLPVLRACAGALFLGLGAALTAPAQLNRESEVFDEESVQLLNQLFGQQIQDLTQQLTASNNLQRKLNGTIIAEVKFEEAPLEQVVAYLVAKSKELDPEKQGVNVVVTPDAEQEAAGKKSNLKLTNVPLGVALRYSLQQLGLTYRLEQYAVVVTVPQRAGTPATSSTAPASSSTRALPAQPVR